MSEETKDEEVAVYPDAPELNAARQQRLLDIFVQLNKSKRFVDFIAANYLINSVIDDENKTIETTVIEKPISVGPKMSPLQVGKITTLIQACGSRNPVATLTELFNLLGQEESTLVLPSSSELKKIIT